MKKYYLSVNPYGGGKKGPRVLKKILPLFESNNIELKIIETEYAGHNRDLANTFGDSVLRHDDNSIMGNMDSKIYGYSTNCNQSVVN